MIVLHCPPGPRDLLNKPSLMALHPVCSSHQSESFQEEVREAWECLMNVCCTQAGTGGWGVRKYLVPLTASQLRDGGDIIPPKSHL